MNIIRKNIPNSLTCLNILSGCVAIVFAFHPTESFGSMSGWQWACLAIGIAAIADFSDGFMARLLKAYSDLGKQLDSLSDLVSFGVAPAMLLMNLAGEFPQIPLWVRWAALLIPICGALRLARFNIDPRQTDGFIGLPIPANAIFWIGWAALATSGWQAAVNPWILLTAIILESLLMTSNIRLFSLKFKNFGWAGNQLRWVLILASLLLIIFWGLQAFCPIIFIYIILSVYPRGS
ncbi:MAG: CDP-diacylglycerol--serine O-phosphatidyltransferase [Muribaculaceae bacterium]|nr:CDP-diacylglycerol--serine O-phosphatidyltransferase [Muribaculaceae bacterium]